MKNLIALLLTLILACQPALADTFYPLGFMGFSNPGGAGSTLSNPVTPAQGGSGSTQAATSGVIKRGDGTNFVNTSYTVPATAGNNGEVWTSNGTNFVLQAPSAVSGISLTTARPRIVTSLITTRTASAVYTGIGVNTTSDSYPGTEATQNADSSGHYIQCTTAASTNSDAGYTGANSAFIYEAMLPKLQFRVRMTDITNCRIQVGVVAVPATAKASADPDTHSALFRYDTVADGTAFWRCYTNNADGDGGTVTVTTTPIAINTGYTLGIDMTSTSEIKFYIDGSLVATHTTELPLGGSLDAKILENIRTLEDVSKTLSIGGVQIDQLQ